MSFPEAAIFRFRDQSEYISGEFYRKQGIPLLAMPSKSRHSQKIDALLPEGRFTKIRAILRSDGQGTVEFGEAFDSVAKRPHAEGVYDSFESLLKDQTCTASFSSSGAYPIQRISKFWFTNGLGSLTIFPLPFAVLSLDHAIRQESRKWTSKTQDHAREQHSLALSKCLPETAS